MPVERTSPETETLKQSALESLADRLVEATPSWLPLSGHVRNITFTLNEADLIADVLRRAALGVAQCPQQWQPIETAPKDGTNILICGQGSEGYYVSDVKWDGEWMLFNVASDDWTEPTFKVSHWMPLPAPPAVSDTSTLGNSK